MKRILTVIIAILMMVSLVACGSTSESAVQKPVDVSTNNVEAPETGNDSSSKPEQPVKTEVTIEETVLVDQDGVKITAKSLNTDGIFGAELKLLIENNSGKDLTIQCRNASVNGYMAGTMMSVDIPNGKKANDAITFMNSGLDACGITDIADMEFSFHIFTSADWNTYLDTAQIPLKTSIAETYEYTFDDSGDVAYDANGIRVIIKGLTEGDSFLGPSLAVYIENNTDKAFTVQSRDVSVNGFMVDSMFSCDVMPGKKAMDAVTFLRSALEENEITAIEDVELFFHIFDSASWSNIVDTDIVSLHF